MDIPQVLAVLVPEGNWGPTAQSDSTYAQFVTGWFLVRQDLPPTEVAMLAAWAVIELEAPAALIAAQRTATVNAFLNATDPTARVTRALALVVRDELNRLRGSAFVGAASGVWDAPSVANGAGTTSPALTVTGAAFGDFVQVSCSLTTAGLTVTGFVSAADTVLVRLHNGTGAAVNLASATFAAVVTRVRAVYTDQNLLDAVTAKIQGG